MSKAKLIVIDDESDLAGFVCDVSERAGFHTTQYTNAGSFKKQYQGCADVIVLDLMMPGVDGVEIIRFLAEINCDAKLILMSGFDSGVLHSAQKLANEHGLDFAGSLAKPFRAPALENLLKSLTIKAKNRKEPVKEIPITEQELSIAIQQDQLVAYFQPKVCLSGTKYYAVEALVRWQHPTAGLIPPDRFIPLAESSGLIDKLTDKVLEQTFHLCKTFLDNGIELNAAVNMSTNILKELDLPERIGKLCNSYQLKPSQIILEITESALMQELVKSLDILTRLRMKGFRLSIDDFGTGYSSMVQLHRAPFSEIKVDRSFVSEMESDNEAKAIVETIIMLGHKLNMKVVAEGVETKSAQKFLQSLGCDQAQGYLFAKPMPKDELLNWYSSSNNRIT